MRATVYSWNPRSAIDYFWSLPLCLFSTGGAAIKAASLTGWQVASFRSAVATLVLLAVVPEARRRWHWRMLPVSVAYAATLVLFVLANRLTTSANAIFLQSTAPLYLLLLGPLVLHEPIRRAGLLYALAVGGGLILFFAGSDAVAATAPDPPRGNLLALGQRRDLRPDAGRLALAGSRWGRKLRSGYGDGRQPDRVRERLSPWRFRCTLFPCATRL